MLRPLWHMGALHPFEQALTLLLAFGPFVVLGIVVGSAACGRGGGVRLAASHSRPTFCSTSSAEEMIPAMRGSILPPTSGIFTLMSRSTVSVVVPPDSTSSRVPMASPGLPGIVRRTSAEVGDVQFSVCTMRISSPTNERANDGRSSPERTCSMVTTSPSMVADPRTTCCCSSTDSRNSVLSSMAVTASAVAS